MPVPSKSEVSRRYIKGLESLMNEFFKRPIENSYPVIMIDGMSFPISEQVNVGLAISAAYLEFDYKPAKKQLLHFSRKSGISLFRRRFQPVVGLRGDLNRSSVGYPWKASQNLV